MSTEPNIQKGIPIEIIVKVKPEPYQRQDLRIFENKISLLDKYDRAVDEFITNGNIFEQIDAFRQNFDLVFRKYLNAIIQGINFSVFTFGAKSTGKSFSLEGNANESGFYSLFVENLFAVLENKRDAIMEEITSLNVPEVEATAFTFQVRMKFVEFKDEAIQDLLQKYNYYKQPAQCVYSENEGFNISGAAWVNIPSSLAFPDLFADALKFRSNYDYNKVNKSSTLLQLEVAQILENRSTRDVKHIVSKINIFDLPSADILAEHFRNLSNSMEYKSIYSFQNMVGELAKSRNSALPTIYENSILTKMMKENIGGNCLCLGIFTLQNNNFALSSIVFKMMKLCSHIQNYPIVNDSNCQGLLKKFRVDIAYYSKYKDLNRPHDVKPPIIPRDKMESVVSPYKEPQKIILNEGGNEELKMRNAQLEKENARLKADLATSEENNKRLMRSLAANRSKSEPYANMMDPNMDMVDQLQHLDEDMHEVNEIMKTVNQLHDKVKALQDERTDLENQNAALKANNVGLTSEFDKIALEANNYKTNADNEIYNLKELLNSTKNELDYMRNEAEKYRKIQADLMLEIDEREVQFKKQLEDREREIEVKMVNISQNERRRLESELREASRKMEHFGQENMDYGKLVEELKKENNKLKLQCDEMRSTMREILGKAIDDKNDKDPKANVSVSGVQINLNNKIKLIKTYTDRENELMEQLGIEKAKAENLKEKLKKMRTYGRKVRNIALDFYPINEELPELLTKEIEVFLEDPENESVIQFLEFEIRTLRERNKKLEYEMNRMKDDPKFKIPYEEMKNRQMNGPSNSNTNYMNQSQNMINPNQGNINGNPNSNINPNPPLMEADIQKKIIEEINKLKNARPVSTSKELEKVKNERDQVIAENKRLKTMINDSLLSRDETIPNTENSSALRQKIHFLEKSIQQLEKERSEYSVRATMAEEQVKNFQELMNATTQQYQKKILELNKRIEASDLRNGRRGNNYYDDI